MSWEQARMKLIDGQAITHPGMAPDCLMLVRPGSTLDQHPDGEPYTPSQWDKNRNDWRLA